MRYLHDEPSVSVLHILTDKNIGGAGRWICYLYSALRSGEFDFTAIIPTGSAIEKEMRKVGIRTIALDGIGDCSLSFLAMNALVRKIKEISPDIVHTHSSFVGRVAARRAGVGRIIMTKHCSDMPPRIRTIRPFNRICERLQEKYTTVAIATSESARLSLIADGMPREKIRVVLNGAPPLRAVSDDEKEATRAILQIPTDAVVVGIFARIEKVKDHETFIRAAAGVCKSVDNVYFLVVGEGSLSDSMEALAAELGIADRVRFTGFVSDIAPYMSICHVNVNTSVGTETSSLAIIEGMSVGVVPVVSDLWGNTSLVLDAGLFCPKGDADSFSKMIAMLCTNRTFREIYSERSKELYNSQYKARRFAYDISDIYRSVMKE